MLPLADVFRVHAGQDFDNLVDSKIKTALLTDAIHAREKFLRGNRSVKNFALWKAVVAGIAVVGGTFLTEIRQQFAAAAVRAFGVVNHLLQLHTGDLLFFGIGFFVNKT